MSEIWLECLFCGVAFNAIERDGGIITRTSGSDGKGLVLKRYPEPHLVTMENIKCPNCGEIEEVEILEDNE